MENAFNDNNDDNGSQSNATDYAYDPYDERWNPFDDSNVRRNWFSYFGSIGCPIVVLGGIFTNILALVVLVRSRLWLKHEGYIYLAANFCANLGILVFCTSSFWMTSVYGNGHGLYYPPNTSNFMCKVWHFFTTIFFASGWLSVALLFNVYLREHLTQRRRCGCPMFAAKYCTLFATKIIVGVIFGVLFVLGIPYMAIYNIHTYMYKIHPIAYCYPLDHVALHITLLIESILMWALPFVLFLPIILVMTLCIKTQGNTFGFSQIEERSVPDDQMRVLAVTLSSMTLFSQFVLVFLHRALAFSVSGAVVAVELAFALSICLQPIICFVILKALRDGFRSQLRNINCCRRMFPSLDRDEEVVRLTSIQEDPPETTDPSPSEA